MYVGGGSMYDFQKADMWKRISAWLFDFIMIGIVIVGVAAKSDRSHVVL